MSEAVVLQASGPNGLGLIRSLAAVGTAVTACDADPRALGLRSRHAAGRVTADPLTRPERFLHDLREIGAALGGAAVLFPTHDEALAALGPHEAALSDRFRLPWSPWATTARVLDKRHQHAAARAIGFPVPATVEPRDDGDIAAAARELRFPMVLKPRNSPAFRRRFRAQVLEVADSEALRRAWADTAPYAPQLSEVIPGDDDRLWTLGSYRDREGRPLASFTGRKLRQWPPRFGTARAAEAAWDPALAARCHALLDELGFHGISQVEVKRDPRDGRDHLIEVNPRSWLWIGLATRVGVNIPEACLLDALGRPRPWPAWHRSGVRWVLAAKHLAAGVREVRRGEWTAGALARSLRPPIMDGVLDPRDPRPGLRQLRGLLARA